MKRCHCGEEVEAHHIIGGCCLVCDCNGHNRWAGIGASHQTRPRENCRFCHPERYKRVTRTRRKAA